MEKLKSRVNHDGVGADIEGAVNSIATATHKFRELSFSRAIVWSATAALAAFFFTLWRASDNNDPNALQVSTVFFVFTLLVFLSSWRRVFVWLASIVAAAAFYGFSLMLLFNQNHYGEYLQFIGFGGGVPIVAHLEKTNNLSKCC